MKNYIAGFREIKCSRCGKVFVPAPQHMYRYDGKWLCRYTCYDQHLDEVEGRKKKGKGEENYEKQ